MRFTLEPNTMLADRYRITGELGRGGMGVVYRAEHTLLGKAVAIKVLSTGGPEFHERFKREARLLARVDHPGVCGVTDFGTTTEGSFFLVMELLDGTTLDRILMADRRLPVRRCLLVFKQIAEALGHCHAAGIVHRDLKPENIMLLKVPAGAPPAVKVLDFGIAVSTHEDPTAPRVTRTGIILGTPAFMSPEQATGRTVDARSDIYALGVMLVETLTGRNPFDMGASLETMSAQAHLIAPSLHEIAPDIDIPEDLDVLVARLLAKDRDVRIQTAEEVAEAIRCILAGEPTHITRHVEVGVPRPGGATVVRRDPVPERTRAPLWAWLFLGAGLVAGVLALIFWGGAGDSPPPNPPPPLVTAPVEVDGVSVTAIATARAVVNRFPEGEASVFPDDVGRVYCHLVIRNVGAERKVVLVWFLNDTEKFRVDLEIGVADAWRTWGVAKVPREATGRWRCDALTSNLSLLASVPFEVKATTAP